MAITEQSYLMRHKDTNGNVNLLYPITTKENVDGMETVDVHLENNEIHVTSSDKTAWNSKAEGEHTHTIDDVTGLQNELDGKADKAHSHAIADVTGLQTALDDKADSEHGTHVSYSAIDPEMDGTAFAGTADTVARSDHKHPTDTSRAAKADLDEHVADTTIHITSTERENWGSAYTHSQAAHAPSDAEKNQNAFSNVKVGDTTVAADTVTDTLTLVAGSNVTITPDATNDKITISSTDTDTTYSAGDGLSLSGTTFSNSGVRSIAIGGSNGSISVNTGGTTTEVNVKGLGSAAYTDSSAYDAAGAASSALDSAKTYADSVGATVKNDLLNGAGEAYDTLKELGDLIVTNQDAIDALETVASGKADKVHIHAIADVTGLQTALDGKADTEHGTHVTYSANAPVMDGSASAGSADTVARSDHAHPTDTSRASKTDLDIHVADTTAHITSTERTNWGAAYTHSQAAHAPSDAEKNQNAFSNVKVGDTTVAADTVTDTLTFAGSNVTITADAVNDKVTFSVASGSTSAKGIVQLTDSTSSTSITTAATPNSVKSAYDLASEAKTTADGKANSEHTHTVANISDLTATAAELNYMDGVTSNVQTQLDGKASSEHTHTVANVTGLQDALDGKADASHTHTVANVTGLQEALDAKAASSHTHAIANVTGLQDALDGKADLDSSGKVPSSQLPDHVASINGQTGAVTVETGGGCTCVTATLTANGWSASSPYAYEQTVSVTGVTTDASQYISVDVALSQTDKDANNAMLEAWNLVAQCPAKQNSGSITFYAADMPSVAISLNIGVGD